MIGRIRFSIIWLVVFAGLCFETQVNAQNDTTPRADAETVETPQESGRKKRVFHSPLQRAIDAGVDEGLSDRLEALEPFELTLRSDAQAICDALSGLPIDTIDADSFTSPAYALVELFDLVDDADSPAYEVISTQGLSTLIQIFDAKAAQITSKDNGYLLLAILRILARYGTLEGTNKVIEAARNSCLSENYGWSGVFSLYSDEHPHRNRLFKALGRRIPSGYIGIALLDSANQEALEDDSLAHPFDSVDGKRQLQAWLEDGDPEHFSYAHSAAVALAFISNPERDQLFGLALDHVNPEVQLEGAWAAARLGRDAGIKVLARFCLEVNHAARAIQYLNELGREDAIPSEATDEAFVARAKFAEWLSHPNELGKAPDSVEVIDQRDLLWPLEKEPKTFYLVRYVLRDTTGLEQDDVDCGLVGSMTWCFFMLKMHLRPADDVYAIHAYWEMVNEDLIRETDVVDESKFADMLNQWTGPTLQSPKILKVAKISRRLKIRSRQVALVSASIEGEPGWVVLDGTESAWYPASEQPEDTGDYAILKIHVGRQLLALSEPLDRKKFLQASAPSVDTKRWIQTFESYIGEAQSASGKRQVELFDRELGNHLEQYIEYRQAESGLSRNELILESYAKLLSIAESASEPERTELFGSFSVLGKHFDDYIDALIDSGRSEQVKGVLELVAPYMDHNLGYSRIGNAAYKAKLIDLAERNFIKLREGLESYYRAEEMGLLARIWFERGDQEQASELLLDCLKKTASEIKESSYRSDRDRFSEELKCHRNTFLELFPDSKNTLNELGIDPPSDP